MSQASNLALEPSRRELVKVIVLSSLAPQITWTANIEPDLAGYKIYKSVTNGAAPTSWSLAGTVGATATSFTDNSVTATTIAQNLKIFYAVKAYDTNGNHSEYSDFDWAWYDPNMQKTSDQTGEITDFRIVSFSPNPFNPTGVLQFNLPESGPVTIRVFDVLGREVLTTSKTGQPGMNTVSINGMNWTSGLYFLQVSYNSEVRKTRILLTK